MLQIRPNCEWCDRDLPAHDTEARICTYECTFCAECARSVLHNVCPNCGGGFAPRPVRPATARRERLSLQHQPASTERVHSPYTADEVAGFAAQHRDVPPEQR